MYFTLLASGQSEAFTAGGVTAYMPFSGWFGHLDSTFATELQNVTVIAAPFTLSNFYVRLSSAPGVGFSRTFTIRKNQADTGVTITISDNNTLGFDYTHTVDFAPGDMLAIKETCVGSPQAATYAFAALGNNPTTKCQHMACSDFFGANPSTSATTFMSPMGGKFGNATEVNVQQVVPAAGSISGLQAYLFGVPGGAASWTITLRKNGVDTALTTTVTGGAAQGSDTTHSVAVAKGDLISLRLTPAGTPSTLGYYTVAVAFTPTIDGDAIYGINQGGNSTSVIGYSTPYGCFTGWNATDPFASYFEPGPGFIKNIYFAVSTAPGGAATWLATLRKHFADTALAVTLLGAATSGETTGKVTYQPGDELTVSLLPTGTPAATTATFISWTLNQQGANGFLALLGTL